MRRKLTLFDIDGTLLRGDGAARDAFTEAILEVYGLRLDVSRFDFSGRTDPGIAHMVLAGSGLDEAAVESGFPRLWIAYLERLRANTTASRFRIMPGITPLLDRLAALPNVTLGLLTGNIEPGARIKLASHDLNRYFPFGAFGSDSSRRDDLPPIAVERANAHGGHHFSTPDAVVIGDSIWDVRCARAHGAISIAVATGPTSAETLRAESADFFFETLEPIDDVVNAIVGR